MPLDSGQSGCWPTPKQELLLKACLLRGREALDAWREWDPDGSLDVIDGGSFRLLPLAYRNLKDKGSEDPRLPRLKGIYRRAWYENQMLFRRMAPFLAELREADVPVMLLKGAATTAGFYENAGLRPMRDLDVLIPEDEIERTVALLDSRGWSRVTWAPRRLTRSFLRSRHSIGLSRPSGLEVDLHWHAVYLCRRSEIDVEFRRDSEEAEFCGTPVSVPSASHLLFQTCIHGVAWDSIPPIRWVADATTILRSGRRIEWDALRELVARGDVTLCWRKALRYLEKFSPGLIPEETMRELDARSISRSERILHSRMTRPTELQHPLELLQSYYLQHAASGPQGFAERYGLGFLRFIRHHLQLESWGELARYLLRWTRFRLGAKTSGRRELFRAPSELR